MSNGEAAILQGLTDDAAKMPHCKDCQAHDHFISVLQTSSTVAGDSIDKTDKLEDCIGKLATQMEKGRKFDPQNLVHWLMAIGLGASMICSFLAAIRTPSATPTDDTRMQRIERLMQHMMKANGIDLSEVDGTPATQRTPIAKKNRE